MTWLALALGALATGVILRTIHKTGETIMATNAEKLLALQEGLTAISTQQTQGVNDLAELLRGLRAEGAELDFGPVLEVVERLRVGAQALDDITPNEVLPDEDGETETPPAPPIVDEPDTETPPVETPGTPDDSTDEDDTESDTEPDESETPTA